MSVASETSRLDLDELTDEIVRLHRLTNPVQPVAAAVEDFVRRVGPDRMALACRELMAEKIRRRVKDGLKETAAAADRRPRPVPRPAPVPVRVPLVTEEPAAEAEEPDVPGPQSGEEFAPGAVLWHTTQSGGYDEEEDEPEAPRVPAAPVARFRSAPSADPDVLAGVLRKPAAPAAPQPPKRPAQQPSWRLDAMRSTTPEETWSALGDMIDVGTAGRKKRADLTAEDEMIIIALARSDEDKHKRLGTEAYQVRVRAERELEAMQRHGAQKISDLPEHVLNSLYGRREP